MKTRIVLAGLIALAACTNENTANTLTIEGTVKNAAAKMIYLEENIPNGQPTIMDSSELKSNGSFLLQAPKKEEALYHLRLAGKTGPLALLISDATNLHVTADAANTAEPYAVKGSAASEALVAFDRTTYKQGMALFTAGSKVDSLRKAQAPDSTINLEYATVEKAAASLKSYVQDFLKKASSPVLTLYALSSFQNTAANLGMPGLTQAEMTQIIQEAAAKFPQHTALQAVKKSIPSAKAPDFSQPGIDGNPVALSSFKGKYVLLDFWASWCKPCRMDNPNVVKAYSQFKDKNFTVFGVSLDQNRDAWLKAIKQDGLTWTHASDLKFWSNEAAALYGVQSIPANFLIDPQGNIVAQDLHGDDIVKTLQRVIK
ncbi:MAG TPA: TlpA disulfide reductase family protein [Flavisolibacter sp.]|jgi:peroxiredoxin|nr:TlpA disulfide reductase family protein [Flavisolibacter sp.]